MTKRATPEETDNVIQTKVTLNTTGPTTYSAGKWTEEEHERFLKAIKVYGNLWKKVRDCVGTRSCAQIRSHSQKYFRRKRNLKLQELKRTNRLKGMVFLVIEEYYNYAGSASKHGETQATLEHRSVKVETKEERAEGRVEAPKQLEMPSSCNSELICLGDPPEDEPNDLSFGLDRMEILANEEGLLNEANRYESEFQLNGNTFYEQDNEINLPMNNQYY